MSMQTLPTELLYRILDLLNAKDIILSFRSVCKRFHAIATNYPRLKLEFTHRTSKSDIRRLGRIVRPENIIALTLKNSHFNSNTTKCFLSSVYLQQLTRLRSLTLCDIEEYDFHTLTTPLVMISNLTSVTVRMSGHKAWHNDPVGLLIPLITLPKIRQLILDIDGQIINTISWPSQCIVQKLTLRHCSYQQYCNILNASPNLRILILNEDNMRYMDTTLLPAVFPSLTSLTLRNIQMSIDELEFFLSLQPFLVSLVFTAGATCSWKFLQRFSQWDSFVPQTLPLLKNLDFSIYIESFNFRNIELVLLPFCTTFWLQEKRWFVTCQYNQDFGSKTLLLYSSTHPNTAFPDYFSNRRISYATTTTSYDNQTNERSMCSARINLSWIIKAITTNKIELPDRDVLHNMIRLAIDVNQEWPIDAMKQLSILIDFSRIEEIWLLETWNCKLESDTIESILQESNIRTLGILFHNDFESRIADLGSIVSGQIDHLKLQVTNVDCIRLTLKYVQDVSSITFQQRDQSSPPLSDMIEWLTRKRINFIVRNSRKCVQVWLDKDTHELSKMAKGRKRKRLT